MGFITLLLGLSLIYYKFNKWDSIKKKISLRAGEIYALETEIMTALKKHCGLDEDFYSDHIPELIHEATQDSDETDESKIDTFLILASDTNLQSDTLFHKEIDIIATHFKNNTGSIQKCSQFLETISKQFYNLSFLVSDQKNLNQMREDGFDIVGQCLENYYNCYLESEDGKANVNISIDTMQKCFNGADQVKENCLDLWTSALVVSVPHSFRISQFYVSIMDECRIHFQCDLKKFVDYKKIYPKGYKPVPEKLLQTQTQKMVF